MRATGRDRRCPRSGRDGAEPVRRRWRHRGGRRGAGRAPRSARTQASTSTVWCCDRSPAGARSPKPRPLTPSAPTVTVVNEGRVSYKLRVDDATAPFWLVLGQSQNNGWKATVKGSGSLGTPTLIDGYANGWYVTPTGSGPIEITLYVDAAEGRLDRDRAIGARARRLPRVACRRVGPPSFPGRVDRRGRVPSSRPCASTEERRRRGATAAITAIVTGLILWFFGGPLVGALAAVTVVGGLLWPRIRPVVIVLRARVHSRRRTLHPRQAAALLARAVVRVADVLRQGPRPRMDRRLDVGRRPRRARSSFACGCIRNQCEASVHRLVLFPSTGGESYDRRVTYEVTLANETTELIDDAGRVSARGTAHDVLPHDARACGRRLLEHAARQLSHRRHPPHQSDRRVNRRA